MPAKLSAFTLLTLALAGPALAESTRTLRVELRGDPSRPFAIENLAGAMRVVPGSGDTVVAVATIHAEDDALASATRFEQVEEKGVPTLRVRYPGNHSTFRYEAVERHGDEGHGHAGHHGFLSWIFGGGSSMDYDGRRVTVSSIKGVRVWADVEVQTPRKVLDATFRNRVGPISAESLEGKLRLDTGSGDVAGRALKGTVVADTGSGHVRMQDVEGSLTCDTGSGDCNVTRFRGENLKCDTGSGAVELDDVQARRIQADTGSGHVRVSGADVEEVLADTGSGGIDLSTKGDRLARVKADTGSGSVHLQLGPDVGFVAHASLGSGHLVNRYADAEPILEHHEVVGYRRGDGRVRITVDTGSGGLVIEPVR
jgi:hypothetical protein